MVPYPCARTLVLLLAVFVAGGAHAADPATDTPSQIVATYDSLADAILALKKTEWNLVHSLVAMTYRHAETALADARSKLAAGQGARGELERLAALVTQIANEGDASVAAVRKRLVEGGHHHHASGEQQGVYDEGFVIVTREAKKALLDAANRIARAADVSGLDAAWRSVESEFRALHKPARS